MTLNSKSSAVTSIDAAQRKLIIGIVIVSLIALGGVIADLAIGGRADPPTLRAAATLLDGSWRFSIGDDPHWADANTDDGFRSASASRGRSTSTRSPSRSWPF
jgi:hypothetical protein